VGAAGYEKTTTRRESPAQNGAFERRIELS